MARPVGSIGRGLAVAAGASCLVAAVTLGRTSPVAIATACSVLVLVAAAVVDVVEHRLPNGLVALAAVPVLVAVAAIHPPDLLRGALVGAAALGGPLLVAHLVAPSAMGFGDVKAGVVLGAALGLVDAQLTLLALVLGLAVAGVWGLATRSRAIALGPGLVAGALAALVSARVLGIEGAAW